jgi:hypothetical protein
MKKISVLVAVFALLVSCKKNNPKPAENWADKWIQISVQNKYKQSIGAFELWNNKADYPGTAAPYNSGGEPHKLFEDLPAGSYYMRAGAPKYFSRDTTFTFDKKAMMQINFVLEPCSTDARGNVVGPCF